MVAYVVEVIVLLLAVLFADKDTADIRLAHSPRTKRSGVRQDCFQELQRDYLPALVHYGLYRGHSYVLKALQVREVALPECHEEPNTLDTLDIQRKRLQFLMVEKIHILFANALEVIYPLYLHGLCFHPFSVLDIAAVCRYLTDIYFRIEVRCERIAMVAAVAVQNVDIVYLIELVLHRIRREYAGNAGIKAAAEYRRKPRLFKSLTVSPLPAVFKLCRVLRLVICRVEVVHTRCKAGVHDVQVLIRKCDIYYYLRLVILDERGQFLNVVCVHLCGGDDRLCGRLQLLLKCVALCLCAARYHYFGEHVTVLAALIYYYSGNAACADYHCSAHFLSSCIVMDSLISSTR